MSERLNAAEQAASRAFTLAFADAPAERVTAAFQRWLDCDSDTRAMTLAKLQGFRHVPVDAETFLRDSFYLGLEDELYDTMLAPFLELNSGQYVEAVLTGGIGSAKTSLAVWTTLRQLYLLSLMENPHKSFALQRSDEIEIILQSITETLAEAVSYSRLKTLLQLNHKRNGYFKREFPHNTNKDSELVFPHRIILKPVSGSNLATIGQNVISGIIDELNYMAIIEKSRKVVGGGGVSAGIFNQAIEVYNSIARRRVSRFMQQGVLPGILCLVSSSKYPGQFTDKKIEEAEKQKSEKGRSTIYVYRRAVWDIKPWQFSKERFRVFEGDEFRKPRLLSEDEKLPAEDASLVHHIPVDFKQAFADDVVNALREMAGVSHISKNPFFANKEKLQAMFNRERQSIFSGDWTDFARMLIKIMPRRIHGRDTPRWAHVDLGLTGDSCGVAIGHCPGFVSVRREGIVYRLPKIVMDGVLEVRPPKGDEINFERVRNLFLLLRDKLGMPIKWVTYDTWQSKDSIQILRQKGFVTGERSIDVDMLPAEYFKRAVYDGRLDCPWHAKLWAECKDVQIDFEKQKVDHLPDGSKDLFDAVAGVVFGLTTRREVWFQHDVPLIEEIVAVAARAEKKVRAKTEKGAYEPGVAVGDGWDTLRR